MKKIILIYILIITSIFAQKQTLNIDKSELQSQVFYKMIDDNILNSSKIKTNQDNKQEICSKKFWLMYKKLFNTSKSITTENSKIKIKLKKNHINYKLILKNRIKETNINTMEIRKESCSEIYLWHAVRLKKLIDKREQENIILTDLLNVNYIIYKTKQSTKKQIINNQEREEAKEKLKREMSF